MRLSSIGKVYPDTICLLIIVIISIATLISYLFGGSEFLSFGSDYRPMAPLSAFIFLILSGSLYYLSNNEGSEKPLKFIRYLSMGIILVCLITICQGFLTGIPDIEEVIISIPHQGSEIPAGTMSHMSAGVFIITCISLLSGLSQNRTVRNLSPILAIGLLSIGILIIEGYWYTAPLLYGGTDVPVSLLTGCCFLLMSIALIFQRRDDTDFGISFYGESVKARILRTFLPTMVLIVIVEGWVFSIINDSSQLIPVLWLGVTAVFLIIIIVIITTILSNQIGGEIDRARLERDQSQEELQLSHYRLRDAYDLLEMQETELRQNVGDLTTREEELRSQNNELFQRQVQLERSEKRYFELFDHISSGVVVYEAVNSGEDFIIRGINRATQKIESVNNSDVIGKRVTEVFPGVREFGILQSFKDVWQTGIPKNHPLALYQDNRISGWRENYIYKLPSGEIVAVYDDVTERKQYEAALKDSEEKFRIIADYTYDWETWEAPDNTLKYVSPSCERITGYSADDFIKGTISISNIIHPEDLIIWQNHLAEIKDSISAASIQFRIMKRDGGERWIQHVCQPILLPSGENLGRRGSNRDITTEKKYKDALQERDMQYLLISENSADVIWIMNLKTESFTFVSPSITKLRGYTSEEAMRFPMKDVILPETYSSLTEILTTRITKFYAGDESLRTQINEVWQPHKDGTMIPTEVVTTLITDEKGTVVEILGVSRDIRERKEAEKTIQKAIAQINQNLETLALLNDQIRNPLTIIELLCYDLDTASARKIHEEVVKIDELIKKVDVGFVQSEKVRRYLTMHYNIEFPSVSQ